MVSYNISEQKWIQCILLDNSVQMLSLEDTLIRSHEICELFFQSPIEEASIYRFLQAFFIIMTESTESERNWEKANKMAKFDEDKVRKYFAEYRSKFDLFDTERPFYQHTDTLGMAKSPMLLLFQDLSTNNNACLFDHSYNKKEQWLPLSRIVVGIIAQHSFSFGGGVSKPGNFRAGTMSGASIFWIKGDNLYQSLLLNTPYLPQYKKVYNSGEPAWEKDLITYDPNDKRSIESYVDYLTFQARRIKIEQPEVIDESNYNPDTQEVFCSLDKKGFSISRCQGDYLEDTAIIEPLKAQRYNEKDDRFFPYKLREDREAWRDAEVLYMGYVSKQIKGLAPKNLSNLKYIKHEAKIEKKPYHVNIYTVNNESGQPKIVMWRRSIMPFYPAIMKADGESNEKFDAMIKLLTKAENISKLLYSAVFNYAKIMKNPDKIVKDINPSGDELKLIKAMTDKLNPQSDYWKALEPIFYNSLGSIAKKNDNENYDDIYKDFKSKSFNTALNAFDAALYNAGSAKAYSIARNTFFNHKNKDEE